MLNYTILYYIILYTNFYIICIINYIICEPQELKKEQAQKRNNHRGTSAGYNNKYIRKPNYTIGGALERQNNQKL